MNLNQSTVLVIDDDQDVLTALRLLLKQEVKEVITEKNPEKLKHLLHSHSFDAILLDMNFKGSINTGNEGLFWLKKIKEVQDIPVVMITAYGDIDLAIRSLKEGAFDFLLKPWQNEKLISTLKEAMKSKFNSKKFISSYKSSLPDEDIIGESTVMSDLFYVIKKVAPTDANVLILGENGTGKEIIAKAIHKFSLRAEKPFIKVDVGSLTESLFESELFGYKKGAFTDAKSDREGRFVAANNGTLFLDEIGNITLAQQAKLLTVLQNRRVTPIGANVSVPIDIRLICATNMPLSELANSDKFRKDLIYRINTVEIIVPPLRERGEDINLLAKHFINIYTAKYGKQNLTISKRAIEKLSKYHFPGNVRELQYVIERAVIMAETNTIEADDLIFSPLEANTEEYSTQYELNLKKLEKSTILKVIEKNNGNISKAAKELGITRSALYRRLEKYDI